MSPILHHRRLWAHGQLSGKDLLALLDTAAALKQTAQRASGWRPLRGRRLALLCDAHDAAAQAFTRAIEEAGGSVALLHTGAWQFGADTLPEAARVLGRLYDAIDCCGLPLPVVEQIERHAGVPVLDGLARPGHPLRLLAELLTMREASGKALNGLQLRIAGDADAAPQRAAALLARAAGLRIVQPEPAVSGGGEDVSPDEPDFVLDPSTPLSAGRLSVPGAPAVEQARIAALLADNRPFVLQSLVRTVLG
jgi:ornithine carbamoyltransferase